MKSLIKSLILLAGSALAMTAWGQAVTVGTGTGTPGGTGIVVPVTLTAGADIAGIDMTVTFTTVAQYSSISVDCGAATVSASLFASCSVAGNTVSIQIADTAATTWVDGLLANITVDIDGAATAMVDPLVANVVGASDTGGTDLAPLPGTTDGSFTVSAAPLMDQTIDSFTSTPNPLTFQGTNGALAATATSGLAVTAFGVISGPCSVAGSTVTASGAGVCVVSANQAGNGTFNPAPQVTMNITIDPADQVITGFAATPTSGDIGDDLALAATGGASGNAVVFTSTTLAVCSVAGSTVSLTTGGNCIVAANQAGNADFNAATQVTINIGVGLSDQTIAGFTAAPAAGNVGDSSTLSATADSGLAVTFGSNTMGICTVSGMTVNYIAVGTCTVTADQAGDASFNVAPQVTLDITVSMGEQTISGFSAAPASGNIDGNSTLSATASSGLTVTFASTTPAFCTVAVDVVSYIAMGQCDLTADQAGDANYNPAPQASFSIDVTDTPILPAIAIPTLSATGLIAMLLLMLGLGGLGIRRTS
ncbi:MAG: hypothetical protein L3J24_08270 [Xanthomonadales bacterium]|nr:hypothetical protein [Xanthomonadales bacterium]